MRTRIGILIAGLAVSLSAQSVTVSAKAKPSGARILQPSSTGQVPRGLLDGEIKLGQDEPGCKDPALLARVAGCSIIQCDTKDFGAVQMRVGASAEGVIETEPKEGPLEIIYYLCPSKVSLGSIVKQNEAALTKGGFRTIYNGKDEDEAPLISAGKGSTFVEVSTYTYNNYTAYVFTAVEDLPEVTSETLAEELSKNGRVALDSLAFEGEKYELPGTADKVLAE
ncbi:MAG TPA: hypothetical protein VEQ63_15060, partial [Bryobacteraceae bacterium]|nr:hypothetical protein [Bryobacteraceae bacterium]